MTTETSTATAGGNNATDAQDTNATDSTDATSDEQLGERGLAALRSEREARKAAEKAAADALAKVKQFEDAQKTEAEKQAERIAEIERENAELKMQTLRAKVAAEKQVPVHLLVGATEAELEASADELLKFRGKQAGGAVVDKEGKSPSGASTGPAQDFASFISKQLA